MALVRRILLSLVVVMSSMAFTCRIGPTPPQGSGPTPLPVPFYSQPPDAFWCGPATVQMWQGYVNYGSTNTQSQIFEWMTTHYPGEASTYGVSARVIAAAATNYVGRGTIYADLYAGAAEERQSLADMVKSLDFRDPTIAIVEHGFHAVIVVGSSWHELSTANPMVDFMIVHDPLRGATQHRTIGNWFDDFGQSCYGPNSCQTNVQLFGRRSLAQPELAEFDYAGGVYYGPPPPGGGRYKIAGDGSCYWDPNDSGPDQCSLSAPTGRYKLGGDGSCYWDANDSGPDQCSPGTAWSVRPTSHTLTRAVSRWLRFWTAPRASVDASRYDVGALRLRRDRGRSYVPSQGERQNARARTPIRERTEVVRSFYSAVAETRLDRMPGLEKLTSRNTDWRVRDVLPVESLDTHSDYYLLHIADARGAIVGAAIIDTYGWLLGFEQSEGQTPPRPLPVSRAADAVGAKAGSRGVLQNDYVYFPSEIEPGASDFAPLVRVRRADGDFFVNSAGRVFHEEVATGERQSRALSGRRVGLMRGGVRQFIEDR